MSNVLHGNCPYFQLPQALVRDGLLQTMNQSELKMYTGLLYKAQKVTSTQLAVSNDELMELAGLAPNSITGARKSLEARGLIVSQRRGRGYTFTLCDPATSLPMSNVWKGRKGTSEAGNVDFSMLSAEQYRAYFMRHLDGREVKETKNGLAASCPFHDDSKPSLSVRVSTGQWTCWGCKQKGGLIDFERCIAQLSGEGIDPSTARLRVIEVLRGAGVLATPVVQEPEAVYPYVDEGGELLFEVVRYPGKRFEQRRPDSAVPGGLVWNLNGVRRLLYRLPDVVDAFSVIVVEGERDVDALRKLTLHDFYGQPVAVTTSPGGAGKWRTDYSKTLSGKSVVIIPDNDQPGALHGAQVLESVRPFAGDVRVVRLPDDVKDVTEYLNCYSNVDFVALVGNEWFDETRPFGVQI